MVNGVATCCNAGSNPAGLVNCYLPLSPNKKYLLSALKRYLGLRTAVPETSGNFFSSTDLQLNSNTKIACNNSHFVSSRLRC